MMGDFCDKNNWTCQQQQYFTANYTVVLERIATALERLAANECRGCTLLEDQIEKERAALADDCACDEERRAFVRLPLAERRRVMAEQVTDEAVVYYAGLGTEATG